MNAFWFEGEKELQCMSWTSLQQAALSRHMINSAKGRFCFVAFVGNGNRECMRIE